MTELITALYENEVPATWKEEGRISAKRFSSWLSALNERHRVLSSWLDRGRPTPLPIGVFAYPSGLLSALRQDLSRQLQLDDIESLHLVVEPTKCEETDSDKLNQYLHLNGGQNKSGLYVSGLQVVGAQWDTRRSSLQESSSPQCAVPVVFLGYDKAAPNEGGLRIPVYENTEASDSPLFYLPASGEAEDRMWKIRNVFAVAGKYWK
mmetsp:Transcript_5614/g.13071  ORF Transcript_5614/g.13071 Transcript_5614/m.13071 type:complete len:207 (+) Transcript_5614:3141-3761(+)